MAHPPRIPVWLEWGTSVTYFITICETKRRKAWDNAIFFEAFCAAVDRLERDHLWFVSAAVVMPNHLHLLASPMQSRDQPVGNLSGALKRWIRSGVSHVRWEWQKGAFDRLLRRDEFAQAKWEYMRENPVRAGLVRTWEEWPWSIGLREPRIANPSHDANL